MEKQYLVVFKKQEGELTNSYSIIEEANISEIPKEIIVAQAELEDKLYTSEELETLRDSLL